MYSILGTGDILVRMHRSWGKMKLNQDRSRSIFASVEKRATLSCTLTRRERMRKGAHTYRTIQRYV